MNYLHFSLVEIWDSIFTIIQTASLDKWYWTYNWAQKHKKSKIKIYIFLVPGV